VSSQEWTAFTHEPAGISYILRVQFGNVSLTGFPHTVLLQRGVPSPAHSYVAPLYPTVLLTRDSRVRPV
jgi:hypothetical protein